MKMVVLMAATLLAGCAASHGSWLDDMGRLPKPPVAISDAEAQSLTAQVLALRVQAEALRAQLANEKDRVQRIRAYTALRKIGDELRPLELRLAESGRPPPSGLALSRPS